MYYFMLRDLIHENVVWECFMRVLLMNERKINEEKRCSRGNLHKSLIEDQ